MASVQMELYMFLETRQMKAFFFGRYRLVYSPEPATLLPVTLLPATLLSEKGVLEEEVAGNLKLFTLPSPKPWEVDFASIDGARLSIA